LQEIAREDVGSSGTGAAEGKYALGRRHWIRAEVGQGWSIRYLSITLKTTQKLMA
jgi:hypothetical protein